MPVSLDSLQSSEALAPDRECQSADLSRNNLDCLRSILALTVSLFHVSALTNLPALSVLRKYCNPHFAVRSFFVISGLLIYRSDTRSRSVKSYFEKWARRIYPAYFTIVVLAALTLWPLSVCSLSRYFGISCWKYLGANLLFLNFLVPSLPGLFASNELSAVNGALWTLKIEVAFYLCIPILHWLCGRFGAKRVVGALFFASCLWKYGFAWLDDIDTQGMASLSALVILPVSVLLFGVYLTHSRGALLALMAVALVAGRRRIGTVPALLLAGGLFVAASARNFTGGRDISAGAGADRTALWGAGLQMLKSNPLFGVGFANFADHTGLTAHNSIVVCAGELGLFGLYFWTLFPLPSVRDPSAIASPAQVTEGEPIPVEQAPFPNAVRRIETIDKAEINRLPRLALLSLTGFLVAGLFLSRAYMMTLFILAGIAEVVFDVGMQRKMIAPRMPASRVLIYAGGLTILLVLFMYVMIRVLNVMR